MRTKKFPLSSLLAVILSISTVINILQARYIWKLQASEEEAAAGDVALIGRKLPPLEVQTLGHKPSTITYGKDNRSTILYIFRPNCMWCQRNGEALTALQQRTSDKYRLLAISLDSEGVEEFQQAHHMDLPIFATPSPSTLAAYQLGTTPQTIVLSSSGVVLADWTGSYTGPVKTAIEKFFGIAI